MNHAQLVSIIIPTHNRIEKLRLCLNSLLANDYPSYEIIVIDNGSTDGTQEMIGRNYRDTVRYVRFERNLGASDGRNAGIKEAKGEYFCFVDSDNIVEANFLSSLIQLVEGSQEYGAVGPKMYYHPETSKIFCSGTTINLRNSRVAHLTEENPRQENGIAATRHVPNVWLVKRSVVEKIGVIDPVYELCFEETDWHMRMERAGFKNAICQNSVVYHVTERTQSAVAAIFKGGSRYYAYNIAKNRMIFMKKFASRHDYIIFLLTYNLFFLALYNGVYLMKGRLDLCFHYLRGFFRGLRILSGITRIADGTEDQARLAIDTFSI